MVDKLESAVALAERVATLRGELRAAEEALRGLLGRAAPPARQSRAPVMGAPVAQRVRDLLHDAGRPLTWAEITGLVGADHKLAARAAVKNLRKKHLVRFAGGKYSWVTK